MTTKAKKSIAAFKVREGMSIGAMVTLRNEKAYEFLDRLISTALPRVRDFRGVSTKSFDGRGNYTLGLRDQLIFPEIDYSKVEKMKGMNITIVTTARDDNRSARAAETLRNAFPAGRIRDKRIYGNHCKKGERRAEAEVQLPQAQPVPALRAAARFPAQVRRLPLVFPCAGAQGRDSRRRQVELVVSEFSVVSFQLSVAFV